ncbi:MAG: DUF3043 domain-containing protein [Actinomycetota bacterium]
MTKDAPTPKRKDKEALNKVNAITAPATKATKVRDRSELKAKRLAARAAYMRGDESALPVRDKGPIRKFVRNYVDSRRNVGEYFLPAVATVLVLSLVHNRFITLFAILLMYAAMLYTVLSGFFMTRKIRKVVSERFPGESTKGLGMYGWLRSTQMRRMRAPAPQVQRGDTV